MMTPDWFSSDVSVWLVQSLAHVLWQGIVLLILAGVADVLLAKRSSQTRYAVWSMTLLLIFCCLPANLAVLAPAVPQSIAATRADKASTPDAGPWTPGAMPATATPMPQTAVTNAVPGSVASGVTGQSTDLGVHRSDRAAVTSSQVADRNEWQVAAPYGCFVYVLGVGVMLVRLFFAAGGTRRIRRSSQRIDDPHLLERLVELTLRVGLRAQPLLATSTKVAVPVVVGIMKPMIVLPGCVLSGLDPAQLEAILLHELAHIRRRDPLINLLQRCAETLLFFQPAVWIVSRRMRVLREDCCDDIVLRCDVPQCLYAESLVAVSELREGRTSGQALAVAAVNPAERSLRRRVLRILGESPTGARLRVTRGAVLTLAALIVLSLCPVLLVLQGNATGQDGEESPHSETIQKLIGNDPGESIYNDELKRFKFRLEKINVRTAETAQEFWNLYKAANGDADGSSSRPKLIGVWGDPPTNSIVIIGPPEAEQAIRESLARWESAQAGVAGSDDTLEIRKVYLERERRGLLRDLALLEVEIVATEGMPDTPELRKRRPDLLEEFEVRKQKLELFRGRAQEFEHELLVIERQLEVLEKHIRRRDGSGGATSNGLTRNDATAPGAADGRRSVNPATTRTDGRIEWRSDGVVWINRGTADRMKRGLVLDITSDDDDPTKPKRIGQIEITRIVSEHLSEARVLQDDPGRPIAKGDLVRQPIGTRTIALTLSPLEPGTVILKNHVGIGPWTDEVPAGAHLTFPELYGRIVRNRIPATAPIREQDLYPLGELPLSKGISFSDLKLVDDDVPEPVRRQIGRLVTISGFMLPTFVETGIKRFKLVADTQIKHFDRHPEPHELVSVQLAPELSTDFIDKAFRVTGVLQLETKTVREDGGFRYALIAARISNDVAGPEPKATGTSSPAALGQLRSPRAVTQVGGVAIDTPLQALAGAKPSTVQLKLTGPEGAQLEWPIETTNDLAPDALRYVVPATIDATSGKSVTCPISKLPGRPELILFASLEVAQISRHTSAYVQHNAIPLQITEEDIDQAVLGNFVAKVVFLPSPQFQDRVVAGVETLITTRLDPGVDPVLEAQKQGHILAVLRLGNRQPVRHNAKLPRVTTRVIATRKTGDVGATLVEISAGSLSPGNP